MIIPVGKTFMILPQHTHSVTSVATSEGVPLIVRVILFTCILACILGELYIVQEMFNDCDEDWLVKGSMLLMLITTIFMAVLFWM